MASVMNLYDVNEMGYVERTMNFTTAFCNQGRCINVDDLAPVSLEITSE